MSRKSNATELFSLCRRHQGSCGTKMKIEHLAIWVDDLEKMKQFYLTYFDLNCGEKYTNEKKGFTSYFLTFGDSQTRLELMNRKDIIDEPNKRGFAKGIAHFAISVGGKDVVNQLTERLRADHYTIESEPRTTGDGYYESVVLDPEGNYVEISG
jgi:lactoylglutathione lyase